jgi:hypothetical protein
LTAARGMVIVVVVNVAAAYEITLQKMAAALD